MNRNVFLLLAFMFALTAAAQAQTVSNVRFSQRTDGRKLVDVYYDLTASMAQIIEIYYSTDDAKTYTNKAITLSGDAGSGISAGNGNHVVWNVGMDLPGVEKKVRVMVKTPPPWDIIGIKYTTIPAGSFSMGSNTGESNEKPVHTVSLSEFDMSAYEITQGQYKAVKGSNPSTFTGDDNMPVEQVSWWDAIKYCNALSVKAGL